MHFEVCVCGSVGGKAAVLTYLDHSSLSSPLVAVIMDGAAVVIIKHQQSNIIKHQTSGITKHHRTTSHTIKHRHFVHYPPFVETSPLCVPFPVYWNIVLLVPVSIII